MNADGQAKVRLRCPKCGRSGSVPAWALASDKKVACPGCGGRLTAAMGEGPVGPAPSRAMAPGDAEDFAAKVVGELVPVAAPPPMPRAQPAAPPPMPMAPVEVAPPSGLLACPDCGGPVSRSAAACPRCGRPRMVQAPQAQAGSTVVVQQYVGAQPAAGGSGCLVSMGALCLIGGLVFLLLLPPLGVLMLLAGLALVVLGKIV